MAGSPLRADTRGSAGDTSLLFARASPQADNRHYRGDRRCARELSRLSRPQIAFKRFPRTQQLERVQSNVNPLLMSMQREQAVRVNRRARPPLPGGWIFM